MGRRSKGGGWTIRIPKGEGRTIYVVRFRHNGRRYEKSTGTSDPNEAPIEAARIYSEIVSGRSVARAVSTDLTDAVASYLADHEKQNSEDWSKIVTTYFRAHLLPFFQSFDRFTPATYGDYMRERIRRVTRASVRKEVSALRVFVAWCAEHGIQLPEVPSVPKHGFAGIRAKNARKRKATIITESEAKLILRSMPECSRRTGEWIRPLFVALWETGLRPTTVLRLEAPLHYRKGAASLFVTREIDKEGFERHVPLSSAARKALDQVCPEHGRLFTNRKGALKVYLRMAVDKAGLTHRNISPYDFRHSFITSVANAPGPLTGAQHLAGHKYAATTSGYIQTSEQAAEAALRARSGGRSGGRKAAGPDR